MPELGSKISLISKADIRYEGRLFTVDPQECTIALANVRSFGTEERETSYPIMPQATVYDYILFRGSDIKDIRVVNNVPIPNDPAIMQMHLPPPPQSFPQQNFSHMQQSGGAPPINQFGAFGQMQGGPMGPNIPQPSQQQQQQAAQSPIQSQHQDSRSGTPQNTSRKSPVNESSAQANQSQRENQSSGGNKEKPHQNQRNNLQRNNNQQQRERRDSGRNEVQENKGGYRNQNQRPHNQMNNHQQPQQQRGYHNNNRNNNNNNQMRGNQGGSARMRNGPPMHVNNYRQQNQGAPNQNQNKPNQNGPQQQQQQRINNKPSTLKFENEFDFEQANSKFEELRSELGKLKVGSEETKTSEQVNGEVEKKDDSGNETGVDHETEVDENAGYDKTKSFFDNISCEAVERSKGKTQRTDWRQERKINSETFGYAFNRRGNFRGRGGYYNNQYNRGPRQGGYRGGNPNYRPLRNHRNQNNDGRNNAPNGSSQGNGPQSQTQSVPVAAN